jgi:hypothetical protein
MKFPTTKKQFHCRNDAIIENCTIGKKTGVYHSIYRCQWCGDYHLTSRNKKGKTKKLKDTNL